MSAPLVAGVIGWPVEHSRSPAIHNAAAAATGVNLVYGALPVPPDATAEALRGVRALGLRGLSITMPHKELALEHVDELSPIAQELGAINHVRNDDGVLWGDNTDGAGFLIGLAEAASIAVEGRSVAILGTGGAARAIVSACADAGAQVGVLSRNAQRAESVARLGGDVRVIAVKDLGSFDIVVNATPVGMANTPFADELPVDVTQLDDAATVVDIVYSPRTTPLMHAASQRGLRVVGGLPMLAGQAAAQFESWTGVSAPFDVMLETISD